MTTLAVEDRLNLARELVDAFRLYMPPPNFASNFRTTTLGDATTGLLQEADAAAGPLQVYVHVPLCQEHCRFCMYYYGIADREGVRQSQCLHQLIGQITDTRLTATRRRVAAAYIGGGTPSVLTAAQLDTLLTCLAETFEYEPAALRTVEVSPLSATAEKVSVLGRRGINRVSMGVQSFDNDVLRVARRQVTKPERVGEILAWCRAAGIAQVNVDLMVGLHGQTEYQLKMDVAQLIDLAPSSITIYRYRPRSELHYPTPASNAREYLTSGGLS